MAFPTTSRSTAAASQPSQITGIPCRESTVWFPNAKEWHKFLRTGIQRPLCTLMAVGTGGAIVYSLSARLAGIRYLKQLNYIDSTTITMVGVLLLRGLWHLRNDSDGQAVSIALIGALSLVFCFGALFKLSFYAFPWRMSPPELREFVIQVGSHSRPWPDLHSKNSGFRAPAGYLRYSSCWVGLSGWRSVFHNWVPTRISMRRSSMRA